MSNFPNFLNPPKSPLSDEGIVVLSLFDGMSCGQLALQKLGVKVKTYFAAEIDKHAIKVALDNFPNTIQLGDVTKVFAKDLPKIDLLIGGSPCQGFSFAGKQLAFDDPRSKLFFEFVRLKNECNPTYFMLENVKMKKEFEVIISRYMGVAPIEINSNLVSAQNRERLYWTNIANEPYGLFGDMQCMIPQPKDRGILLRDILQPESEVPKKYYLSEKMFEWLTKHSQKRGTKFKHLDGSQKASCLTSTEAKQNLENDYILPTETGLVGCLKFGRTEEEKQLRKESMARGKDHTPHAKKEIVGVDFEKMNTLTTASNKDNLLFTKNCLQYDVSGKGYKSQQDRAFYQDGKHGRLSASRSVDKTGVLLEGGIHQRGRGFNKGGEHTEKSPPITSNAWEQNNTLSIRRLTPVECERLQVVPDNYTSAVSDTQRYRMLGNGWTVDVIAHIFSYMDFSRIYKR